MSTYWGYRCVTCNEDSEHWLNHGEDALCQIYEFNKLVAPHKRKFEDIEFSYLGGRGEIFEWLDLHSSHDILLVNEYGDVRMIDE